MENYYYKIKRRLYPGQIDAIPTQLPQTYVAETHYTANPGENCGNCFFNQSGMCTYWKAPIRTDYWCPTWRDITSTSPLPLPASCITGITIPILLTQDFNDIGVYTPWDGLAYQRETLNNFVYTGNGNSITIFNTSNLEFKKFLRISPYSIDWGDGATGTLSPPDTVATHTYGTPSSAYTITLKQVNPWGTTYVSKSIPIPYLNTPPIPNPFGTFAIQPPNLGDPIGCEYITQGWIYSGDSNPDVWDFYSIHHRDVPFQVTGYSYTSQLNMLAQYGNAPYPAVGQIVSVGLSGHGVINTIEPSYTGYTINHIDYIDYSAGTTSYSATSRGLWWGNLDYNCCTDEQLGGCDCTNSVTIQQGGHPVVYDLSTITLLGSGNLGPWTSGYPYIYGDIVEFTSSLANHDCCYVCLDPNKCSGHDPLSIFGVWAECNDCSSPGARVNRINSEGGGPPDPGDPDSLFRCSNTTCSQIPPTEITMSGNSYHSLLALPTVYQTMSACESGCGCTDINELALTITNPIVCSAFVDSGAWNLNCDAVVQILGFDATESSHYTITNMNTGEVKTITPVSGFYTGVDFDNLCPSNYSNVAGGPAGLYNFQIEDSIGCTTTITISVEPDPLYFTVIDPGIF